MSAAILAKVVVDRWRGAVTGTGIVGVWLVVGMAAYRQIDLSIYTDLPEAIRAVMNIPAGADAASLAYGVVYGFVGAMTLAGFAISIGAASIAGEERDGTIGVLLGNPVARRTVLASKAVALTAVTAVGALVLLAAALAAPLLLGVDLGDSHVVAVTVHVFVNALFYGFLAGAIGAWTGNRAVASGATAGIMVLGYVAVGLLPLIGGLADLVDVLPWHWYDGSQPLVNGVDLEGLGLLVVGAALSATAAWVGVERRDLRQSTGATTLLDRLRTDPRTRAIFDRLAGRARVSHIWVMAATENQAVLVITVLVMFWMMGVLMGPMYLAIDSSLASFATQFPEPILKMLGGGDMTTPEGWFQLETFSLMAPIAVMAVTIPRGAKALAGEEADGTMGLLLGNPIPRSRVVVEKAVAMTIHGAIVGVAILAGVVAGSSVSGLGMDVAHIASASLLVTLLGLMFGALALAIGAGTGRTSWATYGAVGVAVTAYVWNSIFAVTDSLTSWVRLSPFHWYLGHQPLVNGMRWGSAVLFLTLTALLLALAVRLFDRRDLLQR